MKTRNLILIGILCFLLGIFFHYLISDDIIVVPVIENTEGSKVLQPETISIKEIVSDTTAEKKLRQEISQLTFKYLALKRKKNNIEFITDSIYIPQEVINERLNNKPLFELQYTTKFEDKKVDNYTNLKVLTYSPSLVDSINISGKIDYQKHYEIEIKPTLKYPSNWDWFAWGVGATIFVFLLTK